LFSYSRKFGERGIFSLNATDDLSKCGNLITLREPDDAITRNFQFFRVYFYSDQFFCSPTDTNSDIGLFANWLDWSAVHDEHRLVLEARGQRQPDQRIGKCGYFKGYYLIISLLRLRKVNRPQ
jgi:hypothetical protein